MMSQKVSIIIPVYNSAAFLQKSVQSLLQQTYPHIEIIIVDDSSTDNSYAIAQSLVADKVKVLQQPNAGAAIARNMGLAAATGDYIQFMDVDDFLSPDKIEKQVAALQQRPGCLAVCNYINFVQDEELDKSIKAEEQGHFIYSSNNPAHFLIDLLGAKGESNFIQTNCWLIPKPLIVKAGGWRAYRCPDDDGEFFSRIILASDGIVHVPGIFNYYRRDKRANKLSAHPGKKYLQNVLLTIDLKYGYLKNRVADNLLRKAFAKQYLDYAIYNYPQSKKLSAIAYRRYKTMNRKAELPLLGGRIIESIKNILGWKAARLIKYYCR